MVQIGESVGILAAQSIGEPGTQLTMRTFHTGGVFSGKVVQSILSPHKGIIVYNNMKGGKKTFTKYKEAIFFTKEEKKIYIINKYKQRSKITLPPNTIIFVKPNQKVFLKQIIAQVQELKKINIKDEKNFLLKKEIKAKLSGQLYFKNNKKIWISSGNIISYYILFSYLNIYQFVQMKEKLTKNKREYKNKLENSIQLNLKKIKKIEISKQNKKITKNYITNRKNNEEIMTNKTKNESFVKLHDEKINLGDFLLKRNNFLKKNQNNYCCQVIEKRKKAVLIRKSQPYLTTNDTETEREPYTLIRKGSILFFTYHKTKKTEDIVQGLPKIEELLEAKKTSKMEKIINNPHDKLEKFFKKFSKKYINSVAVRKSTEKIQIHLIKKIQEVYESQGVKIANKHMELIVKQMTSKVIVCEKGDSELISGEILDLNKIEKINKQLYNKAKYEPLLLGISKLSLNNQSFISEASFQQTTKILTRSAIEGKIDWLYGLKENIIMGNLIPAGTGFSKL
jgi:DNA-directed RNA polymerase subunit beta'